jgi:hypothetical protein
MPSFPVTEVVASTRDLGRQYREELERLLATTSSDDVVVVSFDGVVAMTGSFTDEFLGKLIVARTAGLTGQAPVLLADLTDETAEEVDLCLSRRKVAAIWAQHGSPQLLGGDEVLKETFEAGARRTEFRASELASELGTTTQNMNNRLKRLVDLGTLVRLRHDPASGGREFVYRTPELIADTESIAGAVSR